MSVHSSEPWKAEKSGIYDANGRCVALRHPEAGKEWPANAILLAAAPKLLEACAELIRHFVPSRDKQTECQRIAFDAARAVIAKAEGHE